MNKNQVGLHLLFGLLGLGVSILFLGLGGQFMLETYDNAGFHTRSYLFESAVFCVLGVLCLLFSIGLMQRLQWAKTAFQVLLILGGIGWMAFIFFLARDSPDAWSVLIGMGAAGIAMALFGVLFLENHHFYQDLQQGTPAEKDNWDILDH